MSSASTDEFKVATQHFVMDSETLSFLTDPGRMDIGRTGGVHPRQETLVSVTYTPHGSEEVRETRGYLNHTFWTEGKMIAIVLVDRARNVECRFQWHRSFLSSPAHIGVTATLNAGLHSRTLDDMQAKGEVTVKVVGA